MNDTTTNESSASRREGTVMKYKRTRKHLIAGSIAVAGLAGGAMMVQAATFQDRTTTAMPPAAWPAIPITCASSCAIDLFAGPGSLVVQDTSVPGGTQAVPFLGFGIGTALSHQPVGLAGSSSSTIKVAQGATVTITLAQDSSIADPIALSVPSLPIGANGFTDNHDGTYTIKATKPGTIVYQAGGNAQAPKQVAQGLVGVLIVVPTGCSSAQGICAFDSAAYTDEAVVATTDLDLAFAQNPATFDMGYFGQASMPDGGPRHVYHLINGKSFPDTDVIDVRAGDSLLLRYANAGVFDRTMGLLGVRQTLLGRNAEPYTDPQTFIAPMVGPGETADVAVSIANTVAGNTRYSLMDQGRQMNHGTSKGFGGDLTFINVWAAGTLSDAETTTTSSTTTTSTTTTTTTTIAAPADPTVDQLSFSAPDQLTINATSDPSATVAAAEYSVGVSAAAAGSGTAITSANFGSSSFADTVTITPAPTSGDTIWVRVQDSNSTWSAAVSVSVP
jgi:hypothetical protein